MFTDDERYELQSNEVSCNHLNTVCSATHPDFHQAILNMVVRKNEEGGAWNALLDGEKIPGYHQWYCSLLTCALSTNVSGMLRASFHKLGCWKAGVNHLADNRQMVMPTQPKAMQNGNCNRSKKKCIHMPTPPPCHCQKRGERKEEEKVRRGKLTKTAHAHMHTQPPTNLHICVLPPL